MSFESVRHIFEDSHYDLYETANLRNALSGQIAEKLPRNEMFRMKPDGSYVHKEVNFAWSGYCLGVRDVLVSQNEEEQDLEQT